MIRIMKSLSRNNEADIIEAFNSTYKYLHDLLNTDNIYFELMVVPIYPPDSNSSDTEAPSLDLKLSISNGTVFTKISDKRDAYVFQIVNFPMVMSLDVSHMECTYLSLFVSLKHLLT